MNGNVIGYTMVNDRYQDKYYFDGTAYDIARFIMQFGQGRAVRIIITDLTDGFILSAYGEFLDQINDAFYDEIIEVLLRLQQGEAYEQMIFVQTEPYVMKLIDEG